MGSTPSNGNLFSEHVTFGTQLKQERVTYENENHALSIKSIAPASQEAAPKLALHGVQTLAQIPGGGGTDIKSSVSSSSSVVKTQTLSSCSSSFALWSPLNLALLGLLGLQALLALLRLLLVNLLLGVLDMRIRAWW